MTKQDKSQPSPFVLLDHSAREAGHSYLYQAPVEVFAPTNEQQLTHMLQRLEDGLDEGLYAAGFFTFEASILLEPALAAHGPKTYKQPVAWFGLFKHRKDLSRAQVSAFIDEQIQNSLSEDMCEADLPLPKPQPKLSLAQYAPKFEQVKNHIRAGDVYQINLTFKAHFESQKPAACLYKRLRNRQLVPYGALIFTGTQWALSASPELFIHFADGRINTRPMKGTAKRAPQTKEDRLVKQALQNDEKSQAENLMIVDLMRNDLARLCQIGSVKVKDLFKIETYETLHQMTTTVQGKLRKNIRLREFVTSLLPVGSITGTPKIRATQRIFELEDEPRGLYTGVIGHFTPTNQKVYPFNGQFNVAIRTVELTLDGQGQIGIGGGIVADSKLEAEYEECLLKMAFLTSSHPSFSLIETMKFETDKGIVSLDDHMSRLQSSAHYFNRPCPLDEIKPAITSHCKAYKKDARVRLLLHQDGTFALSGAALHPLGKPHTPLKLAIAAKPTSSVDIYLFHKTTNRSLYDETRAAYAKNHQSDEVLFLNEKGELTEGSFTNLFIKAKGAEQLLTPPINAGLLPGILRQQLLQCGQAKEAHLTPKDLNQAEKIYVGNRLRGLMEAQLIT